MTIRKRGDHYSVAVSAGTDPVTGKRRRIYRTAATEKAAQRVERQLLGKIEAGGFVDAGRLTVAKYLSGHWLPHHRTRVRSRTHQRYDELLRLHVTPAIGGVRLAKLEPQHVQAMLAGVNRSAQTVQHVHRCLSAALAQAVRWRMVPTNVATAAKAPRPPRPTLTIPTTDQMGRILRALDGDPFRIPVALAVGGGLRRGEALALRWADVNLDTGVIRVVRSLEASGGELRFTEPKTARGRGPVQLPSWGTGILRTHRREQLERRLLLGDGWHDGDLVYDNGDGSPVDPDVCSADSADWYGVFGRRAVPRPAPRLRHGAPGGQRPPQDRLGSVGSRHGRVHARHVLPRDPA
jgi:integrase